MRRFLLVLAMGSLLAPTVQAQHSVARAWNEVLLQHIRKDFARPTVHARNLFHTSVAMYDAWAILDPVAGTYMAGRSECPVSAFAVPASAAAQQEFRRQAISFGVYRVLQHRFAESPGIEESGPLADSLIQALGFDAAFSGTDYSSGDGRAFGNYMASCLIAHGLADGSNEAEGYEPRFYQAVNPPLRPDRPGSPQLVDPNRWQPLRLEVFIDQGNNTIDDNTPAFLGPEWGSVTPFSLSAHDLQQFERDGGQYWVYHDPGAPPYLEEDLIGPDYNGYQRGFSMVATWSSHLDPADGVMWDISPASIGNVLYFPRTVEEYEAFYDYLDGGDASFGHGVNPHTGEPYPPNVVPRADYARVLAEFWADGPDSETPPGHWYSILNYVNDHPLFERRFAGTGEVVDPLEWDVKAYFTLGGAMHDAAVTAWGIKGWYDYIRPISAIRTMAQRGQSSDPSLDNYHPQGIPLVPGYIEVVEAGDPLAGVLGQHIGKVKLYAWRGPDFIRDPETDVAGVDWILAENWWSYQRPTFVTPPFAGYVSGHSTFSRAAAEVMTLLTGDEFFPGGVGEFVARKNEFLVFEDGPSVDVVLQWATYRDASDQTSLSRIWGGIHPPADDIPGRIIGERIGIQAFAHAEQYFSGTLAAAVEESPELPGFEVYPNPVQIGMPIQVSGTGDVELFDTLGRRVGFGASITTRHLAPGLYVVRRGSQSRPVIVIR
ncbi:MAG: hypothetical protein JJ896_06405 [Rhodothermales bacterium]|nr:hypothetical protein [Rhodothermales bacterium]MBO6779266.1 hypothetical protein [Rhodothermales bacterium]